MPAGLPTEEVIAAACERHLTRSQHDIQTEAHILGFTACRANNTQVDTCTFTNNAAGQEAGAVFFGNLQYAGLILNSTFVNNSAGACGIACERHRTADTSWSAITQLPSMILQIPPTIPATCCGW